MVGAWLRGFRIEGQAGLAEEAVDEVGLVLDTCEQGLDGAGELIHGGAGEVSKVAFYMGPDPFDRVEQAKVSLMCSGFTTPPPGGVRSPPRRTDDLFHLLLERFR